MRGRLVRRLFGGVGVAASGMLLLPLPAGAATTTTDECTAATTLSVAEYAGCSSAYDTDQMRAEVETGLFLLVFVASAGLGVSVTRSRG